MGNKRILLVEDEKKIADTLKEGLVENGFEVDVAYNGKKALTLYERNTYNLVLLDINLPDITGNELCYIFRRTNTLMPIIILTALDSIQDKIHGYDAGADDFLYKPFEFRELLMKIRVFLRRTETPVDIKTSGKNNFRSSSI